MSELDVVCCYYEPVKAGLLRQAVFPALEEAVAAGVRGHVERHWLHGPHLRVRLRLGPGTMSAANPADGMAASTDGRDASVDGMAAEAPDRVSALGAAAPAELAAAAELVADRLRGHLSRHPSTSRQTPAELLAHSREAGRLELVAGPYEPIFPDNTVTITPADHAPTAGLLGSAELVRLRSRVLERGMPPCRTALDQLASDGDSAPGRIALAITAMTVHADEYPHGLQHGYHSFLSHVEDFLTWHDPDGRVRHGLDTAWERNREATVDLVARIAEGHRPSAAVSAWRAWSAAARAEAGQAYDDGVLVMELGPGYAARAALLDDPRTARRWDPGAPREVSEYHRALRSVDFTRPPLGRSFTVYRFGTNMLYQLLAVCDVTPMERYLAASMMARAVQQVTGTSWREQLGAPLGSVAR
ncbi:hypothetical protein ACQP10_21305 [Streptosporangium sandarakinum]|uniref:hypothetical protein n=1 Tax=Streptosporangium sandarakinum TaxID=1260955 RepID=UPI003D912884